jgi:hypothetical protein
MASAIFNQGKAKEFAPVIRILEDNLRPAEYETVNEGHCGPENAIEPRIGNEYVA